MSKRCCAKMCFNSQTTNRNVHYFGFPKYPSFAMSWAIAAGREDLMEKKMSSVVKYFLCSEHFTSGCFADPPYNTRLKKSIRPEVSIPIPSIFENNIDKYIPKNVQLKVDKLQTNDGITFNGNDLDECYNCEVPSDVHFLDTEMPDINHSGIAINGLINEHSFVDIDALDTLSDSYDFIIEHHSNIAQATNLRLPPPQDTTESEKVTFMCRMCAKKFPTDNELSQIGSINGLEIKLNLLLPKMIQCGDNLSQSICSLCLDKINECINTIDNFRKVQLDLRRDGGIE